MKPSSYSKQVGKRLKLLRKSKGLTVKQLGMVSNMNHNNIAKFERGERDIIILDLYAIANGLNVSAKELLK